MSLTIPLPTSTFVFINAVASASASLNATASRPSSSASPIPSLNSTYSGPYGAHWAALAEPISDHKTTMVVYTILAVTVTLLQAMHCVKIVMHLEPGQERRIFVSLLPGLAFILGFYVMLACYLTNFPSATAITHSLPTLSRIFYSFLYLTENLANILLTLSTLVILHYAEMDYYPNRVVIMWIRRAVTGIVVVAWLAMVGVQTTMYQPPRIIANNAVLTLLVYKPNLMISHAIIVCFNFVTLDIGISSIVVWLHAAELQISHDDKVSDVSVDRRPKYLLIISGLLLIRSLSAIVLHAVAIIPIPDPKLNAIYYVLFVGWVMFMPTVLYVAIYTFLRWSGIPAPIRFREVMVALGALLLIAWSVLKVALECLAACAPRERVVVWVED